MAKYKVRITALALVPVAAEVVVDASDEDAADESARKILRSREELWTWEEGDVRGNVDDGSMNFGGASIVDTGSDGAPLS